MRKVIALDGGVVAVRAVSAVKEEADGQTLEDSVEKRAAKLSLHVRLDGDDSRIRCAEC